MKKIMSEIVIIMAAIVITIAIGKTMAKAKSDPPIGICSGTSSNADYEDSSYYEAFEAAGGSAILPSGDVNDSTKKLRDEVAANATEPTAEIMAMVDKAKEKIRERFSKYDFLYWTRFDATTAKMATIDRDGIMALYDDEKNVLYVTAKSGDALQETIAHELFHALTSNEVNKADVYYEGFTEYEAQQMFSTGGASYLHAYGFAEVYTKKYGEEKALRDYIAGTVESEIDETLGMPGAAKEIAPLITYVSRGRFEAYPQTVIMEIFLKYQKASGAESDCATQWAFKILKASPDYAGSADYLNTLR